MSPLAAASAFAQTQCADAIDNDRDSLIDYPDDADCDSRIDNLERPSSLDLTVTLTDGKVFTQRGELLTYTLTITNNLSQAVDVPVRVSLSNLTYIVTAPTDAEAVDARTLRWVKVSLNANESIRTTFTARVVDHTPDNAGIIARATVGTASATDQSIVRSGALPPPELRVDIDDERSSAAPGEVLHYTVTVFNNSSFAANDLHVSVGLPLYAEFVSADGGGTWDGRNLRWWKVEIPARSSRALDFEARVSTDAPAGRILQASVDVLDAQAVDSTTVGGSAAAQSSVSSRQATPGDPRIVFRAEADRIEAIAGGTVFITLSARNTGRSASEGLAVTQTYDASVLAPMESMGSANIQPGQMTWVLPLLAPGESWQTTVPMAIAANARHGTSTSVHATISGNGVPNGGQDSSGVTLGIMRTLPATGSSLDGLAIVLAGFAALGLALGHRKLIALRA